MFNFCCTIDDSVMHIYMYFFHILFNYGLSYDIEYSSLCYTVRPCCLSILYILASSANTNLPVIPFPTPTPTPTLAMSLFSTSVSLVLFHRYVYLCHILNTHINDVWYLYFSILSIIISRSIMWLQMALFHFFG